jgi:hypothetical protein
VLPLHKGTAPLPSKVRRLADIIITYTPDDPAAAAPQAPHPQAQPNQAGGINISRPDGQGAGASSALPPPPPPNMSGGAVTGLVAEGGLGGAVKQVGHVPFATGLLELDAKFVLHAGGHVEGLVNVDGEGGEEFVVHQLYDGAHFDPLKRGLALAGAGR